MVNVANDTEYLLTLKTAEEYRSKGYEVQREAPLEFLPGYHVDLLAVKDNEITVIEIKTRSSLAANPKIAELARIIESKPGWNFELLLVAEPEKVPSPEVVRSFDKSSIAKWISEAQKSLETGSVEVAFLLAWSASEAVIRELLTKGEASSNGITSTGFVLDQGIYQGVISREQYDDLNRLRQYRNAIIHGFTVPDFDESLVTELLDTIRSIEEEAALYDPSNDQSPSPD